MSYDLHIYTIEKQDFSDLKKNFQIELTGDGFVYPLKNHQIVVYKQTPIEDEDIPLQISKELPGLRYLIECHLEPYCDNEKHIKELLKISKAIARKGIGVIENPQTNEITLPSGIKRTLKTEKTEYYSLLELSWWFNDKGLLEGDNLMKLLNVLEKNMKEALPRRYGEYEPPTEQFSDIKSFHDYLLNSLVKNRGAITWYPTKPVDYVVLSIPNFIGPMRMGYRFGILNVSIDSQTLAMPGWKTAISRLFRDVSSILNPFYGDIYILDNYVRTNTVPFTTRTTEEHPISSWWWNGIPRKFGCGLLIGNPLHDFVNIKNPGYQLNNGCKIVIDAEFNELPANGIDVNSDIYQPEKPKLNDLTPEQMHQYCLSMPHRTPYPKIWPFDGPYKE